MLRSDSCDCSNVYIVTKGRVSVTGTNNDLDVVIMPIYNFLEYSSNYSITSGSLWNYYRDEVNDSANENNDASSYRINSNKVTVSKSFYYKTKLIGRTPKNNECRLNAEVFVPLKYLTNS